jgi:tetratricopeptide (TPR) repeat protein
MEPMIGAPVMIDRAIARQLCCAQAKLQEGDFEAAMRLCQAILDEIPACLPALRIQARAATELGALDVAVMSFRASAEIDPEDEMAHVGLALCAEAQGDPALATAEFRRALELAPYDQRIADEVADRDGEPLVTPLMEARSLLEEGQPHRAIVVLDERVQRTDVVADLTRARALWDLGRIEEVWDLCWQISREHPNCVRALYWLQTSGQLVEKPLKQLEQIAPGLEPYTAPLEALEELVACAHAAAR